MKVWNDGNIRGCVDVLWLLIYVYLFNLFKNFIVIFWWHWTGHRMCICHLPCRNLKPSPSGEQVSCSTCRPSAHLQPCYRWTQVNHSYCAGSSWSLCDLYFFFWKKKKLINSRLYGRNLEPSLEKKMWVSFFLFLQFKVRIVWTKRPTV